MLIRELDADARRPTAAAAGGPIGPIPASSFVKSLRPGGVSFHFSIAAWSGLTNGPCPLGRGAGRRDGRKTGESARLSSNLFLPECLNECSDIRLPASREKRGRSPVRPRTANALLFFTICHTRADDELGRVIFGVEVGRKKEKGGSERSTNK